MNAAYIRNKAGWLCSLALVLCCTAVCLSCAITKQDQNTALVAPYAAIYLPLKVNAKATLLPGGRRCPSSESKRVDLCAGRWGKARYWKKHFLRKAVVPEEIETNFSSILIQALEIARSCTSTDLKFATKL